MGYRLYFSTYKSSHFVHDGKEIGLSVYKMMANKCKQKQGLWM